MQAADDRDPPSAPEIGGMIIAMVAIDVMPDLQTHGSKINFQPILPFVRDRAS